MKHGQRFLFVCWAVMLGTEIANAITITGQARQLTDNSATQTDPQISGNLVVWTDFRNGNDDVYFGDLASNAETRVTTLTTSQRLQAVSGTRIVYTDFTAPGPHVMLYDVTTGLTSVVGTATASNSSIDGQIVVFERGALGATDIYAVDLSAPLVEIPVATTADID